MAIIVTFDRLETDIYNNTQKAFITASDLNRIENNIKELSERHNLNLTTVTNWNVSMLPRQADSDRIIGNVNTIAEYAKNNSDYIPPELPTTLDKATIYTFNTIERVIDEVNELTNTSELWLEDSSEGIHPDRIKWEQKDPSYASGWVTVDMSEVFVDLTFNVNGDILAQNVYTPTANIIYTFEMDASSGDTLWFVYDYATDKGYFTAKDDPGDMSYGYYSNGKWYMPIGFLNLDITKVGNIYEVNIEYEPSHLTTQGNIYVTASYFGTIGA